MLVHKSHCVPVLTSLGNMICQYFILGRLWSTDLLVCQCLSLLRVQRYAFRALLNHFPIEDPSLPLNLILCSKVGLEAWKMNLVE